MFKSGDQLFILPKRTTKRTKNLSDAIGIPPNSRQFFKCLYILYVKFRIFTFSIFSFEMILLLLLFFFLRNQSYQRNINNSLTSSNILFEKKKEGRKKITSRIEHEPLVNFSNFIPRKEFDTSTSWYFFQRKSIQFTVKSLCLSTNIPATLPPSKKNTYTEVKSVYTPSIIPRAQTRERYKVNDFES